MTDKLTIIYENKSGNSLITEDFDLDGDRWYNNSVSVGPIIEADEPAVAEDSIEMQWWKGLGLTPLNLSP
jgi:hypothetical protein